MRDADCDIYLLLNSFSVSGKFQVPHDVDKLRIFKSARKSGMHTDILEVDGFQTDLQEVELHLLRINPNEFRVTYRIVAGEAVFEIYEGECTTGDQGLTLLAETEEELKDWIKDDYPKYDKLFKWGKSGWGAMANLARS